MDAWWGEPGALYIHVCVTICTIVIVTGVTKSSVTDPSPWYALSQLPSVQNGCIKTLFSQNSVGKRHGGESYHLSCLVSSSQFELWTLCLCGRVWGCGGHSWGYWCSCMCWWQDKRGPHWSFVIDHLFESTTAWISIWAVCVCVCLYSK